jgi:hypothetical protein
MDSPITPTRPGASNPLDGVLNWYFSKVYGRHEGPGTTPFYCDPVRVGHCAVDPSQLAHGRPAAVFKLFVNLAMYQARRDVVIMRQQRSFTRAEAATVMSAAYLGQQRAASTCPSLADATGFVSACSVRKLAGKITCDYPKIPCQVREATTLLRRLGDHGKLPLSAYFALGQPGSVKTVLEEAKTQTADPVQRAELLVKRLSQVHRVGRKLATMFVSALSTPALAPGLTPWFPEVDGNNLVVVDTHAARAIDHLRKGKGAMTYSARVAWLRAKAETINLCRFRPELPSYSPRLVQQALYAYGSKSNRATRGLRCTDFCLPGLCPFHLVDNR